MPNSFLRVIANPYTQIDGHGEPQGVCPCDPDEPDGIYRKWVGATIDTDRTEVHETLQPGEMRSARQTTKFTISSEPQTLPVTRYYMRMIRDGALFCADEATATICGCDFTPPAKMLAAARDVAAADWRAHYMTEPPFLAAAPSAPAKAAPKSPAPIASAPTPNAGA